MARSLANIIYKGIAAYPAASSTVSFFRLVAHALLDFAFARICIWILLPGVLHFSTTVPNDPDTHEDFRPSNKIQSSGLSLKDIVEQDVKENPVMIYMKGVPEVPRCGFSALAVRVLKEYNVPLSARNILEDLELKSAVKSFR
ncbi:hypothetical protein DH2020_025713 [Rehmannia glutinosa]|uniref:Glutaredoxin domain-containing protein n=1 Tax=Rehmannia glutinosa TaxID=99300 RepID=A0ABR0W1M3_REHGL